MRRQTAPVGLQGHALTVGRRDEGIQFIGPPCDVASGARIGQPDAMQETVPELTQIIDAMVWNGFFANLRLQAEILSRRTQVEMIAHLFSVLASCYRSVEREEASYQQVK